MEEKQIEEIDQLTTAIYEANHKKSVLDYHWIATELYKQGYRKASDVARDIFEEIDDCYVQMLEEADSTIEQAILEENHSLARTAKYGKDVMLLTLDTLRKILKKKYESEENKG